MSATYRIEIRRDPHSTLLPWDAAIVRLSDDRRVSVVVGKTAFLAVQAAREWINDEEGSPDNFNHDLYVDDQGRDAEAPQSVKV